MIRNTNIQKFKALDSDDCIEAIFNSLANIKEKNIALTEDGTRQELFDPKLFASKDVKKQIKHNRKYIINDIIALYENILKLFITLHKFDQPNAGILSADDMIPTFIEAISMYQVTQTLEILISQETIIDDFLNINDKIDTVLLMLKNDEINTFAKQPPIQESDMEVDKDIVAPSDIKQAVTKMIERQYPLVDPVTNEPKIYLDVDYALTNFYSALCALRPKASVDMLKILHQQATVVQQKLANFDPDMPISDIPEKQLKQILADQLDVLYWTLQIYNGLFHTKSEFIIESDTCDTTSMLDPLQLRSTEDIEIIKANKIKALIVESVLLLNADEKAAYINKWQIVFDILEKAPDIIAKLDPKEANRLNLIRQTNFFAANSLVKVFVDFGALFKKYLDNDLQVEPREEIFLNFSDSLRLRAERSEENEEEGDKNRPLGISVRMPRT